MQTPPRMECPPSPAARLLRSRPSPTAPLSLVAHLPPNSYHLSPQPIPDRPSPGHVLYPRPPLSWPRTPDFWSHPCDQAAPLTPPRDHAPSEPASLKPPPSMASLPGPLSPIRSPPAPGHTQPQTPFAQSLPLMSTGGVDPPTVGTHTDPLPVSPFLLAACLHPPICVSLPVHDRVHVSSLTSVLLHTLTLLRIRVQA